MEHKEKVDKEDKKEHKKKLQHKSSKKPYKRRPSGTIHPKSIRGHKSSPFKSLGSLTDIFSSNYISGGADSSKLGPQRKSRNFSAMPQISERYDTKQYNFKALDLNLDAKELERYKMIYFNSDSIWQRLLPQCHCEFCVNEASVFDPLLKRVKTPYKLNGGLIPNKALTFRKSLSLYSSNMSGGLQNINADSSDLKQVQQQSILSGCCAKETTTALVAVMSIGIKNNKHNFMHMLNDINSKLILSNYLPIGIKSQKSAPYTALVSTLSPISDDEEMKIQRAKTWNETEAYEKPAKHAPHQSLSSVSRDSSYSHDAIPPNSIASNAYDVVPILNVRKLYRIKSLHAAIRTYQQRLAKPLDFKPQYMIKEDVNAIVDIVRVMTHVVKCFAKGHSMPFQVDIAIVPKSIEENPKGAKLNTVDIVSSGDEEEEDDDDSIHTDDEEEFWNADGAIIDDDIGEMLKKGLSVEHEASYHKQCIPLIASDEGIHLFKQYIITGGIELFSAKNPMQNGRYVIIIDRRCRDKEKQSLPVYVPSNTKNDKKDEKEDKYTDFMYFFQPPQPYGEIIDHSTMIETLHLNTLECLIPKINESEDEDAKEEYIGAKHLCKNTQMICISFHVLSTNVIRCYLYMDQKYMRINDWTDLEYILGDYCSVDIAIPLSPNSDITGKRKKYKEFAFEPRDKAFESYYHWAQNHQRRKRNQFGKVTKTKSGALDIGRTQLTSDSN